MKQEMEKYKALGLKLTPQRMAIIDFLEGNTSHPSAEDIYKKILKKFPTISFATVYNTLETLKNAGEVLELTIDPSRKRFDPNPESHHHLICINCQSIVDIHIEFKLDIPINERWSYDVIGNHIEFYGVCPKCKKEKKGTFAKQT